MRVIETDACRPTPPPAASPGNRSVWSQVESGFWVGSAGGDFLGTVERVEGGGFVARKATGVRVGEFGTLTAARMSVTGDG